MAVFFGLSGEYNEFLIEMSVMDHGKPAINGEISPCIFFEDLVREWRGNHGKKQGIQAGNSL